MAQNQQPGNVQLHPMFHANNTGLNYQDVITGNVDCIIPANVIIPADPAQQKYLQQYFQQKGSELGWVVKDAMSGALSKKHKVSLGLIEEWAGGARDLNSLSRTDVICALEVLGPEVFKNDIWEAFSDWNVVGLRPGLYYLTGCNGWTAMPHLLKSPSRNTILERGQDESNNHQFKFPWSSGVGNFVPTVLDIKAFLQFQDYGKYGRGVHPALPQTAFFQPNQIWVTASLGRQGGPMVIAISDIDIQHPPTLRWEGNHCTEASLIATDMNEQVIAKYDVYPRFKAMWGDELNNYVLPTPRNPNLGQDPATLPGTIAFKYSPSAKNMAKAAATKAGAQPKQNAAHAKALGKWGKHPMAVPPGLPAYPPPVVVAPVLAPPPPKAGAVAAAPGHPIVAVVAPAPAAVVANVPEAVAPKAPGAAAGGNDEPEQEEDVAEPAEAEPEAEAENEEPEDNAD